MTVLPALHVIVVKLPEAGDEHVVKTVLDPTVNLSPGIQMLLVNLAVEADVVAGTAHAVNFVFVPARMLVPLEHFELT